MQAQVIDRDVTIACLHIHVRAKRAGSLCTASSDCMWELKSSCRVNAVTGHQLSDALWARYFRHRRSK